MAYLNEDTVERAALDWPRGLGYDTRFGPDIAPDEPAAVPPAAQAHFGGSAGGGY
ncbi:MAG: hypothetical protein AB1435_10240 [Chloroflexota bacterium]